MIVQTVNEYDFVNAFTELRPNNFSRMSLLAMYEAFEEYSDDSGIPFELDVIGICCEFSELYLVDVEAIYGLEEKLTEEETREWLSERTLVIDVDNLNDGLVVIQDF